MQIKQVCSFLVLLLIFLGVLSGSLFGATPEETWKDLGRLSPPERQNLLLSKAREEREIVWYSQIQSDELEKLRQDFNKHYPEIKLNIWRASGAQIVNRLQIEHRSGRGIVDVIAPGNEKLYELIKAGLIGRYRSPERDHYADSLKDRDGYWTSFTSTLAVIAYNPGLVSSTEVPMRYEDFLDAKWKGEFALSVAPDRAIMLWLEIWGEEKTERFLQGLIKNGVIVRKGHTLLAQLLCAGEFKLGIELYLDRIMQLKYEKGCPIDTVFPNPTPSAVTPVAVANKPHHPYGAALLIDYLLSKSAQEVLKSVGRVPSRRDVGYKYPEMDLEKKGVKVRFFQPQDGQRWGRKYEELVAKYLLGVVR